MTPIRFPGVNVMLAKDQPQYQPLPAYISTDGRALTLWKLTWKERIRILFGSPLWISQLTCNQPFQPILPEVDEGTKR